jgi:2-dehydro-3-deoxyphosphooctonate aldolase (KDO 8-P synthase)
MAFVADIVSVHPSSRVDNASRFVLFIGANVFESCDLALSSCEKYVRLTQKLGTPYVIKRSFDKASKSSIYSCRWPGLEEGLKTFVAVKAAFGVLLITGVHEPWQAMLVAVLGDVWGASDLR